MSAHARSRFAAVGLAAAALLMVPSAPASAATPLDEFDAPIFGTSASVVATVMPSLAEVACAHDTCTTGVLPAPVLITSTRYFSTSVAPGGAFAAAPGFQAKVIRSWMHGDDADDADFTLMLIEFAGGSNLDAVVAAEAAARGLTLTGPVQVNGLTTWTASGGVGTGVVSRYSYSVSGTKLAYGRCNMSESLLAVGACDEQKVAALTTAAATRAVPASVRLSKSAQALIPTTPKGMSGVVATQQLSRNLMDVANPEVTSAPRVARQLAGTTSVDLQYGITAQPGLYVVTQIAPVDTPASRAAIETPCEPSDTWTCTSTTIRGSGRGYLERLALTDAPKKVVMLAGTWNGSGRWMTVSCNLTDYTPLTRVQISACSAAIRSLVSS